MENIPLSCIDILRELGRRWPKGFSEDEKPNVISFLNFRLKKQIPDAVTRKRLVNFWLTARGMRLTGIEERGSNHGQ